MKSMIQYIGKSKKIPHFLNYGGQGLLAPNIIVTNDQEKMG